MVGTTLSTGSARTNKVLSSLSPLGRPKMIYGREGGTIILSCRAGNHKTNTKNPSVRKLRASSGRAGSRSWGLVA